MTITYYQDINCEDGWGCPYWAWVEYIGQKNSQVEGCASGWTACCDSYPNDGRAKLCLVKDYGIVEAIWITRGCCWVLPKGEIVTGEITHWRDLPMGPSQQFDPEQPGR